MLLTAASKTKPPIPSTSVKALNVLMDTCSLQTDNIGIIIFFLSLTSVKSTLAAKGSPSLQHITEGCIFILSISLFTALSLLL